MDKKIDKIEVKRGSVMLFREAQIEKEDRKYIVDEAHHEAM